jgi:hypothetical protein
MTPCGRALFSEPPKEQPTPETLRQKDRGPGDDLLESDTLIGVRRRGNRSLTQSVPGKLSGPMTEGVRAEFGRALSHLLGPT